MKADVKTELLDMATELVSAFVSNNPLQASQLPAIIREVYSTLNDLAGSQPAGERAPVPAIAPSKSVTADYIVCLEDGKKLQMLKRYLRTHYDMSPEEYRAKWNLPADYPMVAPNYARKRSELAKAIGLGRKT